MQALLSRLEFWARTRPDAPALRDGAGLLGYGELWQQLLELAAVFKAAPWQRLALLADNGRDWVLADLAALLAGQVLIPLPPFFSPAQQAHVLADSGAEALFAVQAEGLALPGLALRLRPLGGGAIALPPGCCKLTYTSGTTGQPKGVCLGALQLERSLLALAEPLASLGVTHHLCTLPLAVLLENLGGVYLPLYLGACVELAPLAELGLASLQAPEPSRFVQRLAESRADSLILLPASLQWLVAARRQADGGLRNRCWRFIAVGGGKSAPSLLAEARARGLPVYEGYGLSEQGSVVALNHPGAERLGTVGRPLSHLQVRIAADGEVWVRGNGMLGYLGEVPADPDADEPWQPTGDWGELDEDGFLTILGRKKHTLVTDLGRKVAPEWLEAEFGALPGIRQCFVHGDEQRGIHALFFAPEPPERALIEACNARLPGYARLSGWQFTAQPFTAAAGELTANGRLRRELIYRQRILAKESA